MEGSTSNSNSEIPKSRDSPSASLSLESLLVSLPRIPTTDRVDSNRAGTSMGNNSLVSPSIESFLCTQQFEVVSDSQYWSDLHDLLNPMDISANKNFSNGGNLTRDPMSINSGSLEPPLSNLEAQFGRMDYMLHNNLNLYPSILSQNSSPDQPYEAIGTGSFNLGNYLYNSPLTSCSSWNQETLGTDTLCGDTTSKSLVESVVQMMTEEHGHHRFQKLIESCNDHQMKEIIVQLLFQHGLFINVALNQNGSKSIQMLIKLLKRSPIISLVTSGLVKEFRTLMTDKIGRRVIQKCFIHLSSHQNEFLYEAAILHCIELATHKEGCISLNECINCISGSQRDRLLNVIAEHSVFLSQDPSGNYVVQHVMGLQKPDITYKICHKLQGSYVRLSLQQSGSHVVEQCLKSSWRTFAVMDLLASNKLLQVAQDQFGNFVIQKALNITKNADSLLHQILQQALEPHLLVLKFHPTGRHVYNLVKGVVKDERKKFGHYRSQFH